MFLVIAPFLAAAIEGVEMMAILVAVGQRATAGPRSSASRPASLFSPH
jgi:hypothetical protein